MTAPILIKPIGMEEEQLPPGQSAPLAVSARDLLQALCDRPPLCMREVSLSCPACAGLAVGWRPLLAALATFLCRSVDASPICISVSGSDARPLVLLSATSPRPLPAGESDIFPLAAHFPDAPELDKAASIAARLSVAVRCRVAPGKTGMQLCFIVEGRIDPARFGLKQPPVFSAPAEAEATAEWCRQLRAVLQAGE